MNRVAIGTVVGPKSVEPGRVGTTGNEEFRVVELFCGAGGLSLGMKEAGVTIVGACDIVEEAVEVYNRNVGHHARVLDLSLAHNAVSWIRPLRPHLIAGGPPCQDFSSSGKREEGERASMTVAMAVICAGARPEWVFMENVPRAARSRNWLEAREILEKAGYGLSQLVVNASLYGVPQRRKRLILVGRLGERHQFLNASIVAAAASEEMTLREAFGGELGEHVYWKARNQDRRSVFSIDGPCPTIRDARRPQPDSYAPHPGDSNYAEVTGYFFRPHAGARGVYSPDEPGPAVIRTSGERPRASYLAAPHPNDPVPAAQARVLTHHDTARIQGFPQWYDWERARTKRLTDQMIANAVPPPLGKAIAAEILKRHRGETTPPLEGNFGQWLLRSGKVASAQMVSNVRYRLKEARRLLGGRTFSNGVLEIAALEACVAFNARNTRWRSSLRAALRLYREWLEVPEKERLERKRATSVAQLSREIASARSCGQLSLPTKQNSATEQKVPAEAEHVATASVTSSPQRMHVASPPRLTDEPRVLAWFSGGAASAVAARLAIDEYGPERVLLVMCDTGNEDEDNARFERDCAAWLSKEITVIASDEYVDVWDVWTRRRYMAGIHGAPCTTHMKIAPRLAFQKPTDIHVFGYTADASDMRRFNRLQETYFELMVTAPLIDKGIDKAGAQRMIEEAGLALPRSYALGFPNANCLKTGCVKASGAAYWTLYKERFPDRFARTAALSRSLGARLLKIRGKRMFLDELPLEVDDSMSAPPCDFLCAAAEASEA